MVDWGQFAIVVVGAGIGIAAPLLIAALGEAFAERSGMMNLSIEGTMSLGAALAFLFGSLTQNPWVGLLAGMLGGLVIGLMNVYMAQSLHLNQVVTGMSLYIFAYGLSVYIFRAITGHTSTFGLEVPRFKAVEIPALLQIPILGPTILNQNVLIYISIVLVLILEVVMFKTTLGLKIRAVGENPSAADNVGINVYTVRYLCLMYGGAMAGLAGAYISLAELGLFFEGMTAGRGWIAIAIVIFGAWSPVRILAGALIFGVIDSLALHTMVVAPQVPFQLLLTLPYAFSIAILVIAMKRAALPAALFKTYRREERQLG
jgi:simple sugar transport system permease protein